MPPADDIAAPSLVEKALPRQWMMERLLARISQNDLHWLNTMETQELRVLLLLIATAKKKRLDIATLIEEHNRHCTGKDHNK